MWEDFYNEGPSDFDIAIEEFKEGLRKTVKEEILNEMSRLKKENEELQEVKENCGKIKQDYEDKKKELEREKDNLNYTLSRKKFEELTTITGLSEHIYYIDYDSGYGPKCDKCDDNREIHFKSPSGKDCKELCPDCSKRYCVYYVKSVDAIKIRFSKDPVLRSEAWAVKYDKYGDSTTYKIENIWKGTAEDFNIDDYQTIRKAAFDSKELAQKVCDRINKKNNVPDNVEVIKK